MDEFFLRYVPHASRASYEAVGWACVGDGARMGSHGVWSCLMKWAAEGEPREPGADLKAVQSEHGTRTGEK